MGIRFLLPLCAALAAAPLQAAAPIAPRVEAAFTPGDDIQALLAGRLEAARRSIRMQAYVFTDRRIANALLAARKRGVAVTLLADAAQYQAGWVHHLKALHRAGCGVYLNAHFAAFHNKVVIVDGDAPGRP